MTAVGQFILPGTKVRLGSLDNDEATPEYRVVVHCWLNKPIGFYDCYVAFFGGSFPTGEPREKPYILRYASTSLTLLDG